MECLSEELRADKAIVLWALCKTDDALKYVAPHFLNDREVMLEAVRANGLALRHASSDALRNDVELVLEAVKRHEDALMYASDDMKENEYMVMESLMNNCCAFDLSEFGP